MKVIEGRGMVSKNCMELLFSLITGVISGVFVSRIFWICQNFENDFFRIMSNISALDDCKSLWKLYLDPSMAQTLGIKLMENGKVSKAVIYSKIDDNIAKEYNELNKIYTKYMDKELKKILDNHTSILTTIRVVCKSKDDRMENCLQIYENTILEYDKYHHKIFLRALISMISDKVLIIFFLFIVFLLIEIA